MLSKFDRYKVNDELQVFGCSSINLPVIDNHKISRRTAIEIIYIKLIAINADRTISKQYLNRQSIGEKTNFNASEVVLIESEKCEKITFSICYLEKFCCSSENIQKTCNLNV